MAFPQLVLLVGILVVVVYGEMEYKREDAIKLPKQFTKVTPQVAAFAQDLPLSTPMVETTSGIVAGRTTIEGHQFYEIPYAEPPIGKLRWKEPQPIAAPLPEINATTNHFLHCYVSPGSCSEAVDDFCPFPQSEDCLILNVFVPNSVNLSANHAIPLNDSLPVLFYIHGGYFKTNGGAESKLYGEELAKVTNTIVVTFNYRLGALGFLYHKENGQETIKGNQGLKDQRLAMQWVQDNIAKFGGDKNRVTLFGNSAGGQSIALHTIWKKSKDLFANSIQQSNPHIFSFHYPDRKLALRITDRLVRAMKCDQSQGNERECLMNATAEEIMAQMLPVEIETSNEESFVYEDETFIPMIDGDDFTELPTESYRTGRWHRDKDMIIGITTQEWEDLQYQIGKDKIFDEDAFVAYNSRAFGEEMGRVVAEKYKASYPRAEENDYRETVGIETSHLIFDCPSRLMARYASNTTEAAVYFYADSHPVLNRYSVDQNGGERTGCYIATHASEIAYVFRNVLRRDDFTEADQVVEDEFSTYWGSFARTSDPSKRLENPLGTFASWPKYKRNAETGENQPPWRHMHITAPASKAESAYKEDICDFWDSINYGIIDPTMAPPAELTTSDGNMAHCCLFGIVTVSLASLWCIS